MKHTLELTELSGSAVFTGSHQLAPFPEGGRLVGTEPFGPFRCQLTARMPREDWEAAGRPVDLVVDL